MGDFLEQDKFLDEQTVNSLMGTFAFSDKYNFIFKRNFCTTSGSVIHQWLVSKKVGTTLYDLILNATDCSFASDEFHIVSEGKNYEQTFFLVKDCTAKLTPYFLSYEIFGLMSLPIRSAELFGRFDYFFSNTYQNKLYKMKLENCIDLTKKESELLGYLFKNIEAGLSRNDFMNLCWPNIAVHPKVLDVHLVNLKKKLEQENLSIILCKNRWRIHKKIIENSEL